MSRATTKTNLIIAANGQFDKLWKLMDAMSDEQQNATFGSEMATAGNVLILFSHRVPNLDASISLCFLS